LFALETILFPMVDKDYADYGKKQHKKTENKPSHNW